MRSAVIIVARWGASRRPGKMVADIAGRPLLQRLIERVRRARRPEQIVLATTCLPEDDALASIATGNGVLVYRGAVDDVVERMVGALKTFDVEFGVIVEGDELFCEPEDIDRAIDRAEQTDVDCVKSRNVPIGSWVVGVRRTALEHVYVNKGSASTDGWSRFLTDDASFRTEWLDPSPSLPPFDPDLRLTIDYEEDLNLAREVYRRLESEGEIVSLSSVLDLVRREPQIIEINSFRNDAYSERLRARQDAAMPQQMDAESEAQ